MSCAIEQTLMGQAGARRVQGVCFRHEGARTSTNIYRAKEETAMLFPTCCTFCAYAIRFAVSTLA